MQGLLAAAVAESVAGGAVLMGFDFPIGIPAWYAARLGVDDFRSWVRGLDPGSDFFRVADEPHEVTLARPFFPNRARKGHAQRDLLDGLGCDRMQDLLRRCERGRPGRPAAAPLFWTVGAKQVGKAALAGWKELVIPALNDPAGRISLWPFEGPLDHLLAPGRVVLAETYPAEIYRLLDVASVPGKGRVWSKTSQRDRQDRAQALLEAARGLGVELHEALVAEIADGFGSARDGEDRFDAVVGLLGMLGVVTGLRPEGGPADPRLRAVEGWILGLQDEPGETLAPARVSP